MNYLILMKSRSQGRLSMSHISFHVLCEISLAQKDMMKGRLSSIDCFLKNNHNPPMQVIYVLLKGGVVFVVKVLP